MGFVNPKPLKQKCGLATGALRGNTSGPQRGDIRSWVASRAVRLNSRPETLDNDEDLMGEDAWICTSCGDL